jgi:urease subunit beta
MKPGEYLLDQNRGDIEANAGRTTVQLLVKHVGDRPIQIGSHFHFFEVNRALVFDRPQAYGMRLNIAAGTAVRFEPGEEKQVTLVTFSGQRLLWGHNGLVNGALDEATIRNAALKRLENYLSLDPKGLKDL